MAACLAAPAHADPLALTLEEQNRAFGSALTACLRLLHGAGAWTPEQREQAEKNMAAQVYFSHGQWGEWRSANTSFDFEEKGGKACTVSITYARNQTFKPDYEELAPAMAGGMKTTFDRTERDGEVIWTVGGRFKVRLWKTAAREYAPAEDHVTISVLP